LKNYLFGYACKMFVPLFNGTRNEVPRSYPFLYYRETYNENEKVEWDVYQQQKEEGGNEK
jgi:hypothetical protein